MRIKKVLFSIFGIVLFFVTQLSFAQEEMKDQLFVIHEEVAKADMIGQYEKTSTEWVQMMHNAGLDIPDVSASQRDDFHYYYLIPISKYADIDDIFTKFQAAISKMDQDKWETFAAENDRSIETYKEFVARQSADLSYKPKEPRLKQGEGKFIHWIFFHYKLEKRKEVMDVLKEWKKLYEDKNISHAYTIWLMDMGMDNNLVVLTEVSKDGKDYYQAMDDIDKKVQKEEQKLWAKFSPLLIDMEQKYGKLRPDLSYIKN
jgi:hypothetical protein